MTHTALDRVLLTAKRFGLVVQVFNGNGRTSTRLCVLDQQSKYVAAHKKAEIVASQLDVYAQRRGKVTGT